jgi:hypothetical protein
VTIRTANLALLQLIDQALAAAAAAHERRNVHRLRPPVVELEHERVRDAAVNAGGTSEALQQDPNVAPVGRNPPTCELQFSSGRAELVVS